MEQTTREKEFFVQKCKTGRGWSEARALAEWKRISEDPANVADQAGPAWSQLRIFTPAWLFCTETDHDITEKFQEKALNTAGKGQAMSNEQRAAYRAELGKGFAIHERLGCHVYM